MYGYKKKKWYEPQTKLSLNHNIHGERWCLSAMNKMSFEVKK